MSSRPSASAKSPALKRSTPVTLSLVEVCRGTNAAVTPCSVCGHHLRLLVERRDEAEERPSSSTHSPTARMSGSEVTMRAVDSDAAPDLDPGVDGEARLGADADRHHHEVGLDPGVVLQQHPLDMGLAEDRGGRGAADHPDPPPRQLLAQQVARRLVELALHLVAHQVQDGDVHATKPQSRRRLQPEQAAAEDHHLAARAFRGRDHGVGVVEVAVGDDAGQVAALDRNDEGRRAGGDQEVVVGRLAAGRDHDLAGAVDARHRLAETAGDAVACVPGESWMTMSSKVFSPESTGESMMRL